MTQQLQQLVSGLSHDVHAAAVHSLSSNLALRRFVLTLNLLHHNKQAGLRLTMSDT